jgi:hypothetical protein
VIWLRSAYSGKRFRNGLTLSWSYGPILYLQFGSWRARLRIVFHVQTQTRGSDPITRYGQPFTKEAFRQVP